MEVPFGRIKLKLRLSRLKSIINRVENREKKKLTSSWVELGVRVPADFLNADQHVVYRLSLTLRWTTNDGVIKLGKDIYVIDLPH